MRPMAEGSLKLERCCLGLETLPPMNDFIEDSGSPNNLLYLQGSTTCHVILVSVSSRCCYTGKAAHPGQLELFSKLNRVQSDDWLSLGHTLVGPRCRVKKTI